MYRDWPFTLSRRSPNFTGELSAERYREIFTSSCGRYGSTLEYADRTLRCLQQHGIHDPALRKQLMRRYPRHPWPEDPTALISGDD